MFSLVISIALVAALATVRNTHPPGGRAWLAKLNAEVDG